MDLSVVPFASDDEEDNVGEPPVERPINKRVVLNHRHVDKVFKPTTTTALEPPADPVVVNPNSPKIRYAECMRNHAATVGGHANDGCGEFMESQHSPLTCAACGCHRNFHRREVSLSGVLPFQNHHHHHHRCQQKLLLTSSSSVAAPAPSTVHYNVGPLSTKLPPHLPPHHHPPPPPQLPHHHHHDEIGGGDSRSETPERVVVVDGHDMVAMVRTTTPTSAAGSSGKRFRTKFTQEQKDKMLEFAEKLGWRIQRHDDAALNQFCEEIGVRRHVLKVWMHNNKNAHLRRSTSGSINLSDSPSPVASFPPAGSAAVGMTATATTSFPSSHVSPPPPPPHHSVGL